METNAALSRLSSLVGATPKVFSVAGTKDKRGITVQRVSANMMKVQSLLAANKQLEKDQRQCTLRMSDFEYRPEPLRLGDLTGNYFEVVIREVSAKNDLELAEAALSLQRHGFINYFGMQRFGSGTSTSGTHKIGEALLRGEWKEAFHLIMAPQPQEPPRIRQIRELFLQGGDAHAAMKGLPKSYRMERSLLQALINHRHTGFFNAISEALPRNLRLIYLHAFQSFIWNTMVSQRLEQLGRHQLAIGDLVIPRASRDQHPQPIRIEDEQTRAQYSIEDLVYPLPGVDVCYPTHSVSYEAFCALLQQHGLDINILQRPQKDFTLSGGYRHVVTVPRPFSFAISYYDDPKADLLLSDLDRLQHALPPVPPTQFRFKAVTLRFALPSASYATMCIREFTRLSSVDLR